MKRLRFVTTIVFLVLVIMTGCGSNSASKDSLFTAQEKEALNIWYEEVVTQMGEMVSITKIFTDSYLIITFEVLQDNEEEGLTAGDTMKFEVTKSEGIFTVVIYYNEEIFLEISSSDLEGVLSEEEM